MKFVPNAILFIRVNKKCWILLGVSTSFAVNTVCKQYKITDLLYKKRCSLRALFFIAGFLIFAPLNTLFAASNDTPDTLCRAARLHEMVKVKYVIDGDTIVLTDDRHVRLIGINTPEIDHHGQSTQTGAIKARQFLNQLLHGQRHVYLVYDHSRFDRYQRTLAHLFLEDGTNIQAMLLQQGLAVPLTIPPNLSFLDCYQQEAQIARDKNKGIWSLDNYRPLPTTKVTPDDIGYHIITGKVSEIGSNTSAIWINLGTDISLRITRQDFGYFDNVMLQELVGKDIQARGWLYFQNNE